MTEDKGESRNSPTPVSGNADHRLVGREHLILLLIALGALGLRLLYLWGQSRNNPLFEIPKVDAFDHHQWAQDIASGQGMQATPYYRAPLYYYLLGDLYRIVGPSVVWGRVAGAFLGAVTTYLLARFTVGLAGFRAGALAAILAALYWPAIYFEAELLTVGLECLLAVALVLVLDSAARRDSIPHFALAGLVWGLGAITRPNFLALAPAILIWIAIALPKTGHGTRRWIAAGVVCASAALAIAPVTLRNYVVAGEPILISYSGGLNFFIGNNSESNGVSAVLPGGRRSLRGGFADAHRIPQAELGRELTASEVSDYWYARSFAWIRDNPLDWAKHLAHKLRLFWSPVEWPNNQPILFTARHSEISALFWVGFPVIAVLGLAGWTLLARDWRRFFLPGTFLLVYMATVVLFFCNARYRLPVYPFLIVTAAAGIDRLLTATGEKRLRDLSLYLLLAFGVAVALATNPPADREAFHRANSGEGAKGLADYYAAAPISDTESHQLALNHYREAVELKPESPKLHLSLIRELQRLQRRSEAETMLAKAVSLFPKHAELHFELGRALAHVGAFDLAIEAYSATLDLQPAYAEVHQTLGCLLASLNQSERAYDHLGQAIELQPDSIQAHTCLGNAKFGIGKIEEAIEHYERALDFDPLMAKTLRRLGDAHAVRGEFERAIPRYRLALQQSPNLPATSQNLAGILREGGDPRGAIEVLENAIEYSPNDSGLLASLAFILATRSEPALRDGQRALGYAERAVRLEGEAGVQTLDALAAAYAELGRFDLAVENAQKALEIPAPGVHPTLLQQIADRLRLYRAQRTYREPNSDLRRGRGRMPSAED